MKYLIAAMLVLPTLFFGWRARISPLPAPATAQKITVNAPVVLELFTSQGCSSCPPADRVLHELATEDDVIALSFHVDYWNYLGWEDPFSSPYYSARQREYTEQLRARTYTPQLVINGRDELVGSRSGEVKAKVAAARERQAAYAPTIGVTTTDNGKIRLNYELNGEPAGVRVSGILVQNEATSAVRRGENRGKDLHHVNVVRDLVHAPAAGQGSLELTLPEGLSARDAEVVLLVESTADRAIVGAAKTGLSAK